VFSYPPENSDNLRELRDKLRQDSRDSFQLLENFRDNPICSVIHDEVNESLLTLICKHRVYKILGDDTALPAIPSEDRFWIIDKWFPRAVECGLRFAASKRPASYFGKLAVSHIQSAAPAGIECRSFEQLHEAREWLETVTAA
jgi:hypothetical protein